MLALTVRSAADATSHLFFAYLRSLSPDSVRGLNGISALPISLQNLVQETQYPPEYPPFESTSKVVMVVDSVSPTPFALLRRAKHFEYTERTLQTFSDFEDPVQALTDECRRVLKSISSANQSAASTTKDSTALGDSSWSRFEDMGFGGIGDYDDDGDDSAFGKKRKPPQGLRSAPHAKTNDFGRPTTPSWADFLSSGFVEEKTSPPPAPLFLPPDKILPPIDLDRRGKSSQSHKRQPDDSTLEPGELASINAVDLDDAFWWVWITSLAGEETIARKSVFGRCALIETNINGGTWLVIEEMVKGAAPDPKVGAYIAEKKGRFTFGRNRKVSSGPKSMGRKTPPPGIQPYIQENVASPPSKTNIGPDQHARIQAAAAVLQQKQRQNENGQDTSNYSPRRGRFGDARSTKTNSVFTLQPVIMSEAGPAMKWANSYDKQAVRAAYLGDNFAGRGQNTESGTPRGNHLDTQGSVTPQANPQKTNGEQPKSDYGFPRREIPREDSGINMNRNLPSLPAPTPGERTLQTPSGPPQPLRAPSAPLPVAPQMPSQPPPPAPLPVGPEVPPANAVAADAAEVPLPAATPMEPSGKSSSTMDGEPLTLKQTNDGARTNGLTPSESPESAKGGNKLTKQPGKMRGFFGKKKEPPMRAPQQPAPSLAVEAARAAYQGPSMKPNYQAGGGQSLGRRLSGIGRRKTPPASTPTSPPIPDAEEPLPIPTAPFKEQYDSQASLSRPDTTEQRHADEGLSTFDQGPVDQPAFVPAETETSPGRPSFVADDSTDGPSRLTTPERGAHYDPPMGHGQYEPSVSSEERPRTPSPAQDRWAQIRANAAERAANQKQNQHIRQASQDKTEDGEDSGEESKSSHLTLGSALAY